jgi:imidazolonepropionase-like amidohydrolase
MSAYTAIHEGTLIDCASTGSRPEMTVLVRDERIEAVGPTATLAVPQGAQHLDARGLTILPGLIDTHLHVTGTGDPNILRERKKTVPYRYVVDSPSPGSTRSITVSTWITKRSR